MDLGLSNFDRVNQRAFEINMKLPPEERHNIRVIHDIGGTDNVFPAMKALLPHDRRLETHGNIGRILCDNAHDLVFEVTNWRDPRDYGWDKESPGGVKRNVGMVLDTWDSDNAEFNAHGHLFANTDVLLSRPSLKVPIFIRGVSEGNAKFGERMYSIGSPVMRALATLLTRLRKSNATDPLPSLTRMSFSAVDSAGTDYIGSKPDPINEFRHMAPGLHLPDIEGTVSGSTKYLESEASTVDVNLEFAEPVARSRRGTAERVRSILAQPEHLSFFHHGEGNPEYFQIDPTPVKVYSHEVAAESNQIVHVKGHYNNVTSTAHEMLKTATVLHETLVRICLAMNQSI